MGPVKRASVSFRAAIDLPIGASQYRRLVKQFPALVIVDRPHVLDVVTVMHVQRGYDPGRFARVPNYPGR